MQDAHVPARGQAGRGARGARDLHRRDLADQPGLTHVCIYIYIYIYIYTYTYTYTYM